MVAVASLSSAASVASDSGFQATTTSSLSSVTCTSSITITTDKPSYVVGEHVKLSGFITNAYCGFYCPQGATCDIVLGISLMVEDPFGRIVYSNSPSYFDPLSNFSYSNDFILPQNATAGIYTASAMRCMSISVCSNGEVSSTSFSVLTSAGSAWTISISTDKQTYQTGEPIYINGTITGGPTCPPTCSSAWIEITVWTANASGVSGWFGDLGIPITNTTTYHFHATINTGLSAGAYTVNAEADTTGYPTIHGTTSITVETTTSATWTISVATDRQSYGPSDRVHVTGRVAGGPSPPTCPTNATCDFVLPVNVTINIRDQNGNRVYSTELSLPGGFGWPPYDFQTDYAPTSPMTPGQYTVSAELSSFGFEKSVPTCTISNTISNTISCGPIQATTSFEVVGSSTTSYTPSTTGPPLVQSTPGIPGFPIESILAGLVVGFIALAALSKKKTKTC